MLCSPLGDSLTASVASVGSAGQAAIETLRGSISGQPEVDQLLRLQGELQGELEQLRQRNQCLESSKEEAAKALEEERRLNDSLQEQLRAAQEAASATAADAQEQLQEADAQEQLQATDVQEQPQDEEEHQADAEDCAEQSTDLELNVCQSPDPESMSL